MAIRAPDGANKMLVLAFVFATVKAKGARRKKSRIDIAMSVV